LIQEHAKDPGARLLQKRLAEAITTFIHGQKECQSAQQTTEQLFGKKDEINIKEMDEATLLQAMEGVPIHSISSSMISDGIDVVSFLAETGVFPSKSEARKMIAGGGVSINKEKVVDVNLVVNKNHLIAGNYVVVQRGKRNHHLVKQQ
jgi:tyrosyl-tRNA synthetase